MLTSRWDADWYKRIANIGYRYDGDNGRQQSVALPFLFPSLVKITATALGIPVPAAMLTFNSACFLLFLVLLFALGRASGLSSEQSLVEPAWTAFNPFAFFLTGGFSESLFLLPECAFILLLLRRRFWLAACMVAFLAATRFVDLLAITGVWLAIWSNKDASAKLRALWIVSVAGIASLGVVADIAVKWIQSGYPLAAFSVRNAWRVTSVAEWHSALGYRRVFEGDYLPILMPAMLLFGCCAVALAKTWRPSGYSNVSMLLGVGIVLVGSTLMLNPEIHSAGRYLLPLAPALVGLLKLARDCRALTCGLYLATAIGALFMPLVTMRIAMGLPPITHQSVNKATKDGTL